MLSLCNSLLLVRGTVLFPLQQLLYLFLILICSPSLLLHCLSGISDLCVGCFLPNYICLGPYSGTETIWRRSNTLPIHSQGFQCLVATCKLPTGNGLMILQLCLGVFGREVVNLGQNHAGVIITIYRRQCKQSGSSAWQCFLVLFNILSLL